MEPTTNTPNLLIQKMWRTPEGAWSDWKTAFSFGTDISATNDLYDVMCTHFQKAQSPDELKTVAHKWRIFDSSSQEVVEVSGDINFIQYSDFGSYDVAGVGPYPTWIEGANRNFIENERLFNELGDKGIIDWLNPNKEEEEDKQDD